MPKKIKKVKETKLEYRFKEKFLNTKNVHFFFLAILVIIIGSCIGVGVYKYSKDKYHVHQDNPIVRFIYSEKKDDGYNVFEVKELAQKEVYATYSTPTSNEDKKWGRMKYLDFNEEIFASKILDNEPGKKENDKEAVWSLEVEFSDGTIKYYSNNSGNVDKTEFANVLLKYFKQEIMFK